jgi:hypothetical protein
MLERGFAALGTTHRGRESRWGMLMMRRSAPNGRSADRPAQRGHTNFRKQVVEIVRETPDLPSLEILRRVPESG